MNIRKLIIESIEKIIPLDPLEQLEIKDSLAWIKSAEPIFRIQKPDIPNRHLVAFFIPYDKNQNEVLLVHHKKSNWWIFPGGHVEINELPYNAVKRECLEELGIQANFLIEDPIFIAATQTVSIHAGHIDISIGYLLACDKTMPLNFDENEFNDIQWFNFNNIPYSQSDPAMERLIKKLSTMR